MAKSARTYTVIVQKTVLFSGIEASSMKEAENRVRSDEELWYEFDQAPYSSVKVYPEFERTTLKSRRKK